jgi:hypothetical protein
MRVYCCVANYDSLKAQSPLNILGDRDDCNDFPFKYYSKPLAFPLFDVVSLSSYYSYNRTTSSKIKYVKPCHSSSLVSLHS